jgi:hypothetical protein
MISKEKSEIKKEKKDPYTPSNTTINKGAARLCPYRRTLLHAHNLKRQRDKNISRTLQKIKISPARDKN